MTPDDAEDDAMRRSTAVLLISLLVGFLAGPIPPAVADVLVTQDGARIQTDGPWEVKGRLVVFTRPDGSLASLRLRDVDLTASEEVTAAEKKAQEEAEQDKAATESQDEDKSREGEATWKLTDADFTRRWVVDEEGAEDGSEESTEGDEGDEADAASSDRTRPPEVVSYERESDPVDQHVIVTGVLANTTSTTAAAVALEVSLFDEEGQPIEMRRASVDRTVLPPGEETTFRADFPQVFAFAAVQFRPTSTNLETGEGEGPRVPRPEDEEEAEAP